MDALTTNVPLEWIQEEMSSHGLPVTGPAKMFQVKSVEFLNFNKILEHIHDGSVFLFYK